MENIYKDCLDYYGIQAQLRQASEECLELALAISKYKRAVDFHPEKAPKIFDNVLEESADVFNMVNQIRELDKERFDEYVRFKLERTKTKLNLYKDKASEK